MIHTSIHRSSRALQAWGLGLAVLLVGCGGAGDKKADVTPGISQQPQDTLLLGGAPGQLQVVATGTPTPTYQWRKGSAAIPGQTGSALTFAAAQASDEGTYDVIVTNSAGSITSNTATLTVNRTPTFLTQPTNRSVTATATATFTVTVDGKPTPTLQWQSSADGVAWTNLPGATTTRTGDSAGAGADSSAAEGAAV